MFHIFLALIFLKKLFTSSRFSAPNFKPILHYIYTLTLFYTQFTLYLCNFLSRACRTKNISSQVDDVTLLVKKRFFSFSQVFITISKYSVHFGL